MTIVQHAFRRIGRTTALGYSPNLAHPSRLLDPAQDAASHVAIYRMRDPKPWGSCPAEADEIYMMRFELHYRLGGGPRMELHTYNRRSFYLESSHDYEDDITAVVEAFYAKDPESVRVPDREGFTPLHVAASYLNLRAIEVLLALSTPPNAALAAQPVGFVHDDLFCRENALHATPLEMCEEQIALGDSEVDYMRGVSLYNRRLGSVEDGQEIVNVLKRAMGLPEATDGAALDDE